jgi:two-component system cell cycle response regulator DivK
MADATILIVEDNPKNLKLIRDVLQFHGYVTLEAGSAVDAIDLAYTQPPALILMDIQLPDMDGRQAIKILRSDARTRAIPVIAMTAFAMKGDRERLLADGFDDYMAKPIDIKKIPESVGQYIKPLPPMAGEGWDGGGRDVEGAER